MFIDVFLFVRISHRISGKKLIPKSTELTSGTWQHTTSKQQIQIRRSPSTVCLSACQNGASVLSTPSLLGSNIFADTSALPFAPLRNL